MNTFLQCFSILFSLFSVPGWDWPRCLESYRLIRRYKQQQWRRQPGRQRRKGSGTSRQRCCFPAWRGTPRASKACPPCLQTLTEGLSWPRKGHLEGGGPRGGAGEEDQDAREGAPGHEEGDAGAPREDQPGPQHRQPPRQWTGAQWVLWGLRGR